MIAYAPFVCLSLAVAAVEPQLQQAEHLGRRHAAAPDEVGRAQHATGGGAARARSAAPRPLRHGGLPFSNRVRCVSDVPDSGG